MELNIFHLKWDIPKSGLITWCSFSAVNSRVPSGSTSSSHTTESPTPEPCPQAGSSVPPQSVLPMYPSVDIDAHVSDPAQLGGDWLRKTKKSCLYFLFLNICFCFFPVRADWKQSRHCADPGVRGRARGARVCAHRPWGQYRTQGQEGWVKAKTQFDHQLKLETVNSRMWIAFLHFT